MAKNYYLHKDSKTGEILYLEYDKIKGYPITPKTKIDDAIEVNKIILVNPSLKDKMIKKKVEIKIKYLLRFLEIAEEGGASDGAIQNTIMESERLKINILNRYVHYLGNEYGSLCMKQIQLIINKLKVHLLQNRFKASYLGMRPDLYYQVDDVKKGRGR